MPPPRLRRRRLPEHQAVIEILAEAGQCHGGRLAVAVEMVIRAAEAGATAIKFQHLTPELIASPDAALYWEDETVKTQRQAFADNGTLTRGEWATIANLCDVEGVEFLSSPFDVGAVAQLTDLGVRRVKLASGDLTNRPLVEAVAATGLPVILSTGAAVVPEIHRALQWWYAANGSRDVSLLACALIYPCPPEHAHLERIGALRARFPDCRIGYSDHTREVETALAAVAAGATVLEKHYALGPSHVPDTTFALTPDRLAEYVRLAQLGETLTTACGTDCEHAARVGARRSVCAARDLPADHVLSLDDFVYLRPGDGHPPWVAEQLVGMRLREPVGAGGLIVWP